MRGLTWGLPVRGYMEPHNLYFLALRTLRKNYSARLRWSSIRDQILAVGLGFRDKLAGLAFLLNAYVKSDAKFEELQLRIMRTRLQLIKSQLPMNEVD